MTEQAFDQDEMTARLATLRDHLITTGSIKIAEMATRLRVSPMTIRGDLVQLDAAGIDRRRRGGAVAVVGPSFAERYKVHARAKAQIAAKLAKMLPARASSSLDSSSSILRRVAHLDNLPRTV